MTCCPQWPEEEDVPGFKTTYLRYLEAVENLSYEFTELVAVALGLPPDGLAEFFDARELMQHRSKVGFHYSTAKRDQITRWANRREALADR
jgi:isopenicillin N synthase-like dioxygenase